MERIFEDDDLEALRRKYFPRVPWTEAGPVRRRYYARAVREDQTVAGALEALAIEGGIHGFDPRGGKTIHKAVRRIFIPHRQSVEL